MNFFKGKISTFSFDFFRIAIALLSIVHFYSFDKDYLSIYGSPGLVQPETGSMLLQKYLPNRNMVLHIGSFMHLGETGTLQTIKWLYYLFLFFLLIGFITRFSAFVCLLLHLVFIRSALFLSYGVDYFTTISFVYCVLLPVARRVSIDSIIFRPDKLTDIFYLRILQIHVCIIYFFAGLAKAMGGDWWNGIVVWKLLMRRPMSASVMDSFARHIFILAATGIIFLLTELLYVFLIWNRHSRKVILALTISMHLFIGVFMQLYYFAAIMLIYNIAAFVFTVKRKKTHP